jgi:zinc metalloprotease ZmpB
MINEFNAEVNGYLLKDEAGNLQSITHFDEPYVCSAASPQLAAAEYLAKFSDKYGIGNAELTNLDRSADRDLADNKLELRFEAQKDMFDTSTVSYQQTFNGLPIWGAGVTVQIRQNPNRVLSSYATNHAEMTVNKPSATDMKKYKSVSVKELKTAFGWTDASKTLQVVNTEFYIYQFKAAERILAQDKDENGFCSHEDHIELPVLPNKIVEKAYYVAAKVLFKMTEGNEVVPYIALIDVATDAVLYLRSMSSNVSGFIFNSDPLTMSGNPANTTTATDVQLNPLRTLVTLQGLVAPVAGIQSLKGNFVEIKEIETPVLDAPTQPIGANFNYNVRTNEFSAVNAYYNNDRFFRLVTGMGFPATYWGTTVFPTPVDHRGLGAAINAHCVGNGTKGIGHTCYALAASAGTPIGIADDWRVVLHELGGHGILYCSVNSPNFGFAHSAGDSFAAILNDPGSVYSDRFVTFPWFAALIPRRHDRSVASGWAWGGASDVGGYSSEQILSSTMFRFYQSIGGDSINLATRHFAARMTAYLLLRAIGNLTPTHTTQTGTGLARVTAFYNELVTANIGDWTTEGHVGGAYSKVLRWAFEKQGLFQPATAIPPFTTAGAANAIDVYINDGRNGEYTYQPNFSANPNIWNRLSPDGSAAHQEPIVGAVNYAYVKIKNRGTTTAVGVTVKAFQTRARAGSEYPLDWVPMLTPILAAANVPANNTGEVLVGPFQWIPTQVGYECMTMVVEALGDGSNINSLSAGETMPEWRLIPNDNNIGQRKVAPKWF